MNIDRPPRPMYKADRYKYNYRLRLAQWLLYWGGHIPAPASNNHGQARGKKKRCR